MTPHDAKRLFKDRTGRPYEWDWDAIEAGEVLSKQLPDFNLPRVNRDLLSKLKIGESIVVVESPNRTQPGAQCQSYAARAGISITTSLCLLLPHGSLGGQHVIVVTRTGKK